MMSQVDSKITETFTWFYVATQDVWVVFILVVWYKYGHIKLGKDNDKPEYRYIYCGRNSVEKYDSKFMNNDFEISDIK